MLILPPNPKKHQVVMYLRILTICLFLLQTLNSIAQYPIDTLHTLEGTMIIYSNRTWRMLEDETFDGIMNESVNAWIESDTSLNFVHTWDHDMCYTSDKQNDLSKLKDTLWVCLLDKKYKDFVAPVPGMVTSRYGFRHGRYHNGIDLDLETGDPVRSAWAGKVRYAKYNEGGFGNLVIVRHYNGLETFYAHLSELAVSPDQEVAAGEVLGLGGNTGRSYGSHLHFEVRFYDGAMNPEQVIDFEKKCVKDENLFIHKGLFRPGAKPTDQEEHGEAITTVSRANTAARRYYRVRSGDTLSEIAARNNTSVSRLCSLNGIRPTRTLQLGQSLRVR